MLEKKYDSDETTVASWSAREPGGSVLHVITGLNVGGAEVALKRLVLADPEARFRHVVVSLQDVGRIGKELQDAGVPVHALHMGWRPSDIRAPFRLASLIRELNPTIIQTWMYHANLIGGIAALLARRREIIWGIRNCGFAAGHSVLTIAIMRVCALLSHVVPRTIVCCADSARRAHIKWGYRASIMKVIPNGYTFPDLTTARRSRQQLRESLGIPANAVVIGSVARFDPIKNHKGLIQAVALVASGRPEVAVLLVGRGMSATNSELRKWITDSGLDGRVYLAGERRDVTACLAAMDVFCLSSLHEAFPNVVAEAMGMALPCVVTDVGDAARIVGDVGWVVPPRNTHKLAEALTKVVELSAAARNAMGESARVRVEQEFSLAATQRLFEEAYERARRRRV